MYTKDFVLFVEYYLSKFQSWWCHTTGYYGHTFLGHIAYVLLQILCIYNNYILDYIK